MKDLSKKLEKTLNSKKCETTIIKQIDEIIEEFGITKVNSWRNLTNRTKNTLLHELVEKNYLDVVQHVIVKYNLRTFFKRESDQATPIELARTNHLWKMWELLYEFGDDKTLTETYDQFASKKQKDRMMNIVWMDLEFTSFQNPIILECAVIITDKDLNEIERSKFYISQTINTSHRGEGLFSIYFFIFIYAYRIFP
jgi:RNA-binding protein YhbY